MEENKNKDGGWRSIGNYLLGLEEVCGEKCFVAKNVAGDWRVCWRDDTLMYAVMLHSYEDDGAKDYLHCLLTLMYCATIYPHDLARMASTQEMPLMEGFAKLIQEQNDYEVSLKGAVSDAEDEKALEDTVEYENLREDLTKIYGTIADEEGLTKQKEGDE